MWQWLRWRLGIGWEWIGTEFLGDAGCNCDGRRWNVRERWREVSTGEVREVRVWRPGECWHRF